jgi:hypothetical protein
MDAQCETTSGGTLHRCDTAPTPNTCVLCDTAADCGGMACKPDHSCSAYAAASQAQCEPCDTDAACAADHYCVPMTYGSGGAAHGSFCLKDATVTGCAQPSAIPITGRSSVDGHTSPYCGINEMLATCEAVNALVNNIACPSGLDSECPEGGLCRTVGFLANRCTYQCGGAVQCDAVPNPGSTCGTGSAGAPSYCGG